MKVLQTITRLYVDREQLEASIAFYESFFGESCGVRESYPEIEAEAAQVGSFLLIAGPERALESFKNTQANLLVDSIEEWKDFLLKHGATIIEGPKQAPTGLEMRVQHPDGAQIKYVQFSGSVYQNLTSR
ncbi:hypothetical protein KSF_097680 [Reticulibacter mediterranei]|uniref:Glyoxalase n=1 Tax=Reticulibacter mediterranei TaxID=2778369 RepID=A0A8J3IZQ9_9CHLR|nr:hypothetical protein [Reticulibacter mediterranei]GHO99720.1 hypothetical protein KSF_097680 [Reticulibacter mediterranei]